MSLKVGQQVLIYKNQGGVLFSEVGTLEELRERKKELNASRFFTAWIVEIKELPTEKNPID